MVLMHPRVGHYLNGMWKRALHTRNWPYLALLIFIVLPLLWIAYSMAVRAGMFGFSNVPKSEAPSSDQVKLFLTFIGGGLATAATLFAALFTREHNIRDRRRLHLEAVLKSLDFMSAEAPSRMAGVLSTMVVLGQPRIAIRVLEPEWDRGNVDNGTATWVIGQVLTGDSMYGDPVESDYSDEAAINEAATLLSDHADRLIEKSMYYFPGHFLRHWKTEKELPTDAKDSLLMAMGRMLTSRDKAWWCPSGDLPVWPTIVLMECARKERIRLIRMSAAVLLAALHDCFPKQFEDNFPPHTVKSIQKQAARAAAHSVPGDYFSLADKIRSDWGIP